MALAIFVNVPGANGQEISGAYDLSHGITPGLLRIEVPPVESLQPICDITFSDGATELTFRDCRIMNCPARSGPDGQLWSIQAQDHRWRWETGYINGDYNYAADCTELTKPEAGTLDQDARKTARELAEMLIDAMGETGKLDVSAFDITDDYPQVAWDYASPAAELANLCDRYGFILCWDPVANTGTIERKGIGNVPEHDARVLSETAQPKLPPPPKTLLGIAEWSEYEVTLELEAVGLDTDGTVKLLVDLSYKPADAFASCPLHFSQITGTDATDTERKRRLAVQSVYRWYRVKSGQVVGALDALDIRDILPISSVLVTMAEQIDTDATKRMVRTPCYVRGVFWDQKTSRANSGETIKIEDVSLDEEHGIVKFSYPVMKLNTADQSFAAADLKLRCTIWGERHTREKEIGGPHGVKVVPCKGITAQYIYADEADGIKSKDNVAEVEGKMDKILAQIATQYQEEDEGTKVYAGIGYAELSGRVHQVSWSVGPQGATTTVSVNREHSYIAPREDERRKREKNRTPATAGMREEAVLEDTLWLSSDEIDADFRAQVEAD